MSRTDVQQILEMIDRLPESERDLLEQHLEQRAEAEWHKEAEQARREAKVRGIDQAAVDEAVRKARYGQ